MIKSGVGGLYEKFALHRTVVTTALPKRVTCSWADLNGSSHCARQERVRLFQQKFSELKEQKKREISGSHGDERRDVCLDTSQSVVSQLI